MDVLNKLEIYVPVEAEVKKIPLRSLPDSVLRRMDLKYSDSDTSKNLTDSPEGILIWPVVIRRKSQKPASPAGNGVTENMSSLLGTQARAKQGPFQMAFVSSNIAAYDVLKNTMPGKCASQPFTLPQGSAPQAFQDAVVIYHGHIYLTIKNPGRGRTQKERLKSPRASWSPRPLLLDFPSRNQKKKLLNDKSKNNHDTDVPRRENKNAVTHQARGRDASSRAERPVPQPRSSAHQVDRNKKTEGGRSEETTLQPAGSQPQGEPQGATSSDSDECEMQDVGGEEADRITEQNGDPSSSQSGTRRESVGAAAASTSLQMEFDFNALAEEEKIAQMKARLRQNQAALKNLSSSK